MKCRICDNNINSFMSFGKMPLANGFLAPEQFDDEYFFELKPAFCENCLTFQIIEQPNPEKMFHDSYAFFSRTSKYMVKHFQDYAEWAMASYFESDRPFVVEIGSNDGVMLENFANKGIKHLGIEPSANVAKEAQKYGVNTIVEFFNAELANRIIAEHGQADAILAANVMCHIPNLHSIAEAVDKLLKLKGVLIFEDPYLGDMIEKTSYDQIYDEHVYIFSAHSVINIFKLYGLELIDVKPQITHGGSMRYVFARQGQRSVSVAVAKQLTYERNQGLHLAPTFEQFRKNCEQSRERLVDLLNKEKAVGHRVVGYAATSKSTTVLNYCAIGSELIEFISDTTPIKQGKYSPGAHIPVRPYAMFTNNYPDAALLFAWNHKKEIMEKETAFTQKGGQWLTYVDV